jgi:hypothetical protein
MPAIDAREIGAAIAVQDRRQLKRPRLFRSGYEHW